MKIIIDLPETQLIALSQLCAAKNISRAEAVRQAVDGLLKNATPQARSSAFGLWKNKGLNSRKRVDQLRDEWATR